jgi:LmbE family N-acetylglucosaminyl deacetylase
MRRAVVEAIRRHRPHTILTHYIAGRHPDHRLASELVRDAAFLAGLKNYPADGAPFRPDKVAFAMSYREDDVKATFIVDTAAGIERKLKAMACFASQWDASTTQGGELHPTGEHLFALVRMQDGHAGSRIRSAYGEPFWTHETVRVSDIVALRAQDPERTARNPEPRAPSR